MAGNEELQRKHRRPAARGQTQWFLEPLLIRMPLCLLEDEAGPSWSEAVHHGRAQYTEHLCRFLTLIKHPEALAQLTVDPLADDPESPWNTIRQDESIRAEILQDVQRLPDEVNYHEDRIQLIILDILFVYCKLHPDRGGYRQGMHELLAPIVYVVDQDAFDRRTLATTTDGLDEVLLDTVDASFIEHDAYVLFARLMEKAQSFYAVQDSQLPGTPRSSRFPEQTSAIVEQSKHIHQVCLRKIDPELADHLTDVEILPQIFLIRWIRLLFSREFPFNQSLAFWDAIFAVDPSLDLIDLICCSMLLRIRWQLLESDYSKCLQLLLKYPSPSQPNGPWTFVDDALYLRDHMNPAAGASLLLKYTGMAPKSPKSPPPSDAGTPRSGGFGSLHRRGVELGSPLSPLRSPARFIQQQGGVETLLQGVLEKGEKLGINQAVREAMGEIRRNVQGLNEVRQHSQAPTTSTRGGPPDEGAADALAAMQGRNQQLAGLLGDSVASLKAISMSGLEDQAKLPELLEVAAARIQLVQLMLQDPSLEIAATTSSSQEHRVEGEIEGERIVPLASKDSEPLMANVSLASKPDFNTTDGRLLENDDDAEEGTRADRSAIKSSAQGMESPSKPIPTATIPARSTIAQSSFSWMLEPDISGSAQTTPSSGKSPPTHQRKRGVNNASRERNAFLFGEAASTEMERRRGPFGSGDIFGMEPISKPKK